MRRRGFALVNAVIIVGALAAVAVAALAAGEAARGRQVAQTTADQAAQYAEAAGLVLAAVLEADAAAGETDHAGEGWAEPREGEPIDRGSVDWRMSDLQGRFNVNWLADEGEFAALARAAFIRLADTRGLPPLLAARAADALDPAAEGRDGALRGGPRGSRPRVGALVSLGELLLVDGMTADELARIAPVLAALPADAALNVNTAEPEVLAAFLPGQSRASVLAALRRVRRPVGSVEEFQIEVLDPLAGGDSESLLPGARLAVGSEWFEAEVAARLDGTVLRQRMLFWRPADGGGVERLRTEPDWEP
ncbi:MAG: type II secretion system minor pseudopilin GspK [Rhodobacteraceae bacterium]|jgi:general secretion pathway protein K|nr:type II secretion system minor pseudopilin GspK [Paracoccaceae bacterium]